MPEILTVAAEIAAVIGALATVMTVVLAIPPSWVERLYHGGHQPKIILPIVAPAVELRCRVFRVRKLIVVSLLFCIALGIGGGIALLKTSSSSCQLSPTQSSQAILGCATAPNHLILSDNLANTGAGHWQSTSNCEFVAGAYRVTSPVSYNHSGGVTECFAGNGKYSDFALQVGMTITSGSSGGGLILRADAPRPGPETYEYRLLVTQGGEYNFFLQKPVGPSNPGRNFPCRQNLVNDDFCKDASIATGLNQENTVTAVVCHEDVYLYVNGTFIDHMNDRTLSAGSIGLFANYFQAEGQVLFRNARVWSVGC
jgi:hypothetical protein